MTNTRYFIGSILSALLFLFGPAAWAQWELDSDRSSINFVSVKNSSVGEVHSFGSLVGFIGDDGNVKVVIDLDSVDTLIEIRDERMRELLFESGKFPSAQVTAQVEPAVLDGLREGGTVNLDLPLELSLHGISKPLLAPVVAVADGAGGVRVYTASPVLLSADDFGLVAGVNALREIAGLKAISTSVPVTVNLVFQAAQE